MVLPSSGRPSAPVLTRGLLTLDLLVGDTGSKRDMAGTDTLTLSRRRRCSREMVLWALTTVTAVVVVHVRTANLVAALEQSHLVQVLDQYRRGDADAAVATFALWDAKRVDAETRLPIGDDDPWAIAALAMLHVEAALVNDLAARSWPAAPRDTVSPKGSRAVPNVHSRASIVLMQRLGEIARGRQDSRLLEFYRRSAVAGAPNRVSPEDDSLWNGRFHEHWMGPEICCGGISFSTSTAGESGRIESSHGRFVRSHAFEAEKAFRDVLSQQPTFAEARLRLGRLLYFLDRAEDSERELVRALKDARAANDVFSGYLAALFLGQLHEDRGRTKQAAESYETGIAIFPSGQSAYLSLGRLLIASGDADKGWRTARSALAGQPGSNTTFDPWYVYPAGSIVWEYARQVQELRVMVRQ